MAKWHKRCRDAHIHGINGCIFVVFLEFFSVFFYIFFCDFMFMCCLVGVIINNNIHSKYCKKIHPLYFRNNFVK